MAVTTVVYSRALVINVRLTRGSACSNPQPLLFVKLKHVLKAITVADRTLVAPVCVIVPGAVVVVLGTVVVLARAITGAN